MSWVAISDVVKAIEHVIEVKTLAGPVNVTAPEPVTNREFTKTLGRVLMRPTIMSIPDYMAVFLMGEMANELLLSSQRVVPKKLLESGYKFKFKNLEVALRWLLAR